MFFKMIIKDSVKELLNMITGKKKLTWLQKRLYRLLTFYRLHIMIRSVHTGNSTEEPDSLKSPRQNLKWNQSRKNKLSSHLSCSLFRDLRISFFHFILWQVTEASFQHVKCKTLSVRPKMTINTRTPERESDEYRFPMFSWIKGEVFQIDCCSWWE